MHSFEHPNAPIDHMGHVQIQIPESSGRQIMRPNVCRMLIEGSKVQWCLELVVWLIYHFCLRKPCKAVAKNPSCTNTWKMVLNNCTLCRVADLLLSRYSNDTTSIHIYIYIIIYKVSAVSHLSGPLGSDSLTLAGQSTRGHHPFQPLGNGACLHWIFGEWLHRSLLHGYRFRVNLENPRTHFMRIVHLFVTFAALFRDTLEYHDFYLEATIKASESNSPEGNLVRQVSASHINGQAHTTSSASAAKPSLSGSPIHQPDQETTCPTKRSNGSKTNEEEIMEMYKLWNSHERDISLLRRMWRTMARQFGSNLRSQSAVRLDHLHSRMGRLESRRLEHAMAPSIPVAKRAEINSIPTRSASEISKAKRQGKREKGQERRQASEQRQRHRYWACLTSIRTGATLDSAGSTSEWTAGGGRTYSRRNTAAPTCSSLEEIGDIQPEPRDSEHHVQCGEEDVPNGSQIPLHGRWAPEYSPKTASGGTEGTDKPPHQLEHPSDRISSAVAWLCGRVRDSGCRIGRPTTGGSRSIEKCTPNPGREQSCNSRSCEHNRGGDHSLGWRSDGRHRAGWQYHSQCYPGRIANDDDIARRTPTASRRLVAGKTSQKTETRKHRGRSHAGTASRSPGWQRECTWTLGKWCARAFCLGQIVDQREAICPKAWLTQPGLVLQWTHQAVEYDDFISPWQAQEEAVELARALGFCSHDHQVRHQPQLRPAKTVNITFAAHTEVLIGIEDSLQMYSLQVNQEAIHDWEGKPWGLHENRPPHGIAWPEDDDQNHECTNYGIRHRLFDSDPESPRFEHHDHAAPVPTTMLPQGGHMPPWMQEIWRIFNAHATVMQPPEGPTMWIRTWYIHHDEERECRHPRELRLDEAAEVWEADTTALWRDRLRPQADNDIILINPPVQPAAGYEHIRADVILQQPAEHERLSVLLTMVLPGTHVDRIRVVAHSVPHDQNRLQLMRLAGLPHQHWFDDCTIHRGQRELHDGMIRHIHGSQLRFTVGGRIHGGQPQAIGLNLMQRSASRSPSVHEDEDEESHTEDNLDQDDELSHGSPVRPNDQTTILYGLGQRTQHAHIAETDYAAMLNDIADTLNVHVNNLLTVHELSHQARGVPDYTRLLIVHRVNDIPVASTHQLVLIDIIRYEHHEDATGQRAVWLMPDQLARQQILERVNVHQYCRAVDDRCIVQHNGQQWPLQDVQLRDIEHGHYFVIHLAPPEDDCLLTAKHLLRWFQEKRLPESDDDEMAMIATTILETFPVPRGQQDGLWTQLSICETPDTLAIRGVQNGEETSARRPQISEMHNWIQQLWPHFDNAAQRQDATSPSDIVIQTWYLNHENQRICHEGRPLQLTASFSTWHEAARQLWADHIDDSERCLFGLVRPPPSALPGQDFLAHLNIDPLQSC